MTLGLLPPPEHVLGRSTISTTTILHAGVSAEHSGTVRFAVTEIVELEENDVIGARTPARSGPDRWHSVIPPWSSIQVATLCASTTFTLSALSRRVTTSITSRSSDGSSLVRAVGAAQDDDSFPFSESASGSNCGEFARRLGKPVQDLHDADDDLAARKIELSRGPRGRTPQPATPCGGGP